VPARKMTFANVSAANAAALSPSAPPPAGDTTLPAATPPAADAAPANTGIVPVLAYQRAPANAPAALLAIEEQHGS